MMNHSSLYDSHVLQIKVLKWTMSLNRSLLPKSFSNFITNIRKNSTNLSAKFILVRMLVKKEQIVALLQKWPKSHFDVLEKNEKTILFFEIVGLFGKK